MLGSPILDLAIGMVFIYLLLSLIASVLQEILATITQARAANLERGLHSLFSGDSLHIAEDGTPGKSFVEALYEHGLVRGLYQDPAHDSKGKASGQPTHLQKFQLGIRHALRTLLGIMPPGYDARPNDLLLPAYIPARTFSLALTDLLNDDKQHWDSLRTIEAHLLELKRRNQVALDTAREAGEKAGLPPETIAQKVSVYENKAIEALHALLIDAGGRADKFQANLENWYNDAMDRTSGWYKRYTQRILLVLGLFIAMFFNVDSVHVARTLWFDHDARQGLTNAADTYIKNHPDFASASTSVAPAADRSFDVERMRKGLEATVNTFDTVSQNSMLPIGWQHPFSQYLAAFQAPTRNAWLHLLLMLVGWCITAAALSLGAPFWFDMLNKIMVIRNTVKPAEKSPNETSKS